jgi:hypothetical protein
MIAIGAPINMSLPNTPFDPALEAALVTGAGNGIGHPSPKLWSAKACEAVKLRRAKKTPPY